jgi:hypothetical protein
MCIDEPWNDCYPAGIDDLGVSGCQATNIVITPNRNESISLDRERIGYRQRAIYRVDPPVH